ncbi:MAG: glycosyltransferase family 4 protein [Gemmataceae bacterium]|nr:glycosyltransferase family 4 protein [Gemmataceae bacterium]
MKTNTKGRAQKNAPAAPATNGTSHNELTRNGKNGSHAVADKVAVEIPVLVQAPPPLVPLPEPERVNEVKAPDSSYPGPQTLAIFCYDRPDSAIGRHVSRTALALAERGTAVHVFSRYDFDLTARGVCVDAVGECEGNTLIDQVHEFNSRVSNAFLKQFPVGCGPVALLGHEWSTIPTLSLLQATRNIDAILSLHSLERQRSDMTSILSRQIEEIEQLGLRQAKVVWIQEAAAGEAARQCVPECAPRITLARQAFPVHEFQTNIDVAAVKARFDVGPIDPLILYVGDFDERHAPDVVMKSVPAVLRNHSQARFVFVGDGTLFWPMRVHARYLLLEYAVRLAGHVGGTALHELIQAADVVMVPSRAPTEWWQVQAAWAAKRPVVTTHEMVGGLQLRHEHNAVLTYPHESSMVWGIERVLFDAELAKNIGEQGYQLLEQRFGWGCVAEQLEELSGLRQLAPTGQASQ